MCVCVCVRVHTCTCITVVYQVLATPKHNLQLLCSNYAPPKVGNYFFSGALIRTDMVTVMMKGGHG